MQAPDVIAGREAVASEIRALLARKKLRHVALAGRLSLSPAAMSRRLSGELPFDIDELQQVAAFLDVTVPDLVRELPVTVSEQVDGRVTIQYPGVVGLMIPSLVAA